MNDHHIKLFESVNVRSHWDDMQEKWYFSVVDVVQVLTESDRPRKYWSDLKAKLQKEGSEVSEEIGQLKMPSRDGKSRETDTADVQTLLRLIQSIPSPKAEPFKLWLAKVGYERMQEIADPVQSLDRARKNWQKLGRSEKWIQQRMTGQETRNKLTDYWQTHGVEKPDEFALLTNIIHQEWAGVSIKEHKALKTLDKTNSAQNLRDHMSEAELIFTALAELSTRQIAVKQVAEGLQENAIAGVAGGRVAKRAKDDFELQTGQAVVTGSNFLPPVKTRVGLPLHDAVAKIVKVVKTKNPKK
jgi:DNA-damage-inducible protein D